MQAFEHINDKLTLFIAHKEAGKNVHEIILVHYIQQISKLNHT